MPSVPCNLFSLPPHWRFPASRFSFSFSASAVPVRRCLPFLVFGTDLMRLTYFPSSAGRSKQYEQTQLMSGTAEVVVEEEKERRRSRAAKTPSSSSEVATIGGKSKADKFHSEPNSLPTSLSYIYTLSLFTRERMLIVVPHGSLSRVIITTPMLLFLRSRHPPGDRLSSSCLRFGLALGTDYHSVLTIPPLRRL